MQLIGAAGREQQGTRLRRDDAAKGWVNGQVRLFQILCARAVGPKENCPWQQDEVHAALSKSTNRPSKACRGGRTSLLLVN